jgi:uncharacterized protein (DUF2141 family)
MIQNFTQNKEPLAPSYGWKASLDSNQGVFSWIVAIYDNAVITGGVTACIEGQKNQDGEITPVIFTASGQIFPILGKSIKSSGNDKEGNAFTTTSNVNFYVYRGY